MEHVAVFSLDHLDLVNIEFPLVIKVFVLSTSGLHFVAIQVSLQVEFIPLRLLLLS
jgi:hypothetical protein